MGPGPPGAGHWGLSGTGPSPGPAVAVGGRAGCRGGLWGTGPRRGPAGFLGADGGFWGPVGSFGDRPRGPRPLFRILIFSTPLKAPTGLQKSRRPPKAPVGPQKPPSAPKSLP